jgi:hypothetical protein
MSGGKGIHIEVGADKSMTAHSLAPVKVSSSDVFGSDSDPRSILATAKSPTGRPLLSSEITDDSLITYKGQTFTAELAARMGLLHKSKDGEYTDPDYEDYVVGTAEERKAFMEEDTQERVSHRAALMGPETATMTTLLETEHGPSAFSTMLGKAVAHYMSDESQGTKAVEQFAQESGLSFSQSKAYLNAATSNVFTTACQMAGRYLGTEPEKVYEFYQSCQPQVKVNLAIRLLNGDITAASELTSRYKLGNRF